MKKTNLVNYWEALRKASLQLENALLVECINNPELYGQGALKMAQAESESTKRVRAEWYGYYNTGLILEIPTEPENWEKYPELEKIYDMENKANKLYWDFTHATRPLNEILTDIKIMRDDIFWMS